MIPWTEAHQGPLFMGFSQQELPEWVAIYPPEDLPHPRIKPESPAFPALAGGFFPTITT